MYTCSGCGSNDPSFHRDHCINKFKKPKEELISYGSATRSKKPRFALIPHQALVDLVNRFELGEIRHAPNAWNALSKNRESALTKEWVIAGLEHVINHCFIAIGKIEGTIENDGDDDAGAIMFGGCVLSEFNRTRNENGGKA